MALMIQIKYPIDDNIKKIQIIGNKIIKLICRNISVILSFVVPFFTIWFSLESLKETKNSLETAQRARIVPLKVISDGEMQVGSNWRIKIVFENTGSDVASDIVHLRGHTQIFPIDRDSTNVPFVDPLKVGWPTNNTCEENKIESTKRPIYPKANNEDIHHILTGSPMGNITKELLEGEASVIVLGCFIYKTFEKVRHSPYCFYWQPHRDKPRKEWTFEPCPSGSWGRGAD